MPMCALIVYVQGFGSKIVLSAIE